MRNAELMVLGLLLASCGQPHSYGDNNAGGRPQSESSAKKKYTVDGQVGGTFASGDGVLSLTIPPLAFSGKFQLLIERLEATPEAALTGVYQARAVAQSTADGNATFMDGAAVATLVAFSLAESTADDIGTENLAIGVRAEGASEFVNLAAVVYDRLKEQLFSSSYDLGDFVVFDLRNADPVETCACDTSSSCNSGCACDPECCDSDDWVCDSGQCIPASYECDVFFDCSDGSDEDEHCPSGPTGPTGPVACSASQWQCDNGACIHAFYECDNISDCADGSDEDAHCDDDTPVVGGDGYESDNSFATAKEIEIGETQTHSIHVGSDHDYVQFVLASWANITLETGGVSGGDTVVYLYNAQQTQLGYDDEGGTGSYSLLTKAQQAPGTYYAMVKPYYSSPISSYTLKLTTTAATAYVAAPTGVTTSQTDGVVTVSWNEVAGASSYMVYYDTDSAYAPFAPAVNAAEGAPPVASVGTSLQLHGLARGLTYYVVVSAIVDGTESSNSWSTSVMLPPEADPYEPDNSFAQAKVLEPGEGQQHSIHVAGDEDYATFTLAAASDVILKVDTLSSTYTYIYLYNSAQTQIAYDYSQIHKSALAAGKYYVKVKPYYGSDTVGAYTLSLASGAVPTVPTNVVATPGTGWVTIAWSAVAGATSYRVRYDNDTYEWNTVLVTANEGASPVAVSGATTLTLTGLPGGQMVYLAVAAANGVGQSAYSALVSTTTLASPDTFESDNSFATASALTAMADQNRSIHTTGDNDYAALTLAKATSIVLTATASAGDTRLRLYNNAQNEIASEDNTSVAGVSRLARALAAGTYYVLVEAQGASTIVTSYKLSLTQAPTRVTAVADAGTVTVSWDAVAGATGYRVYYDDDAANPPYSPSALASQGASPIASTATSLTLTGLATSESYHFAVTAVAGALESPYSAGVTATP